MTKTRNSCKKRVSFLTILSVLFFFNILTDNFAATKTWTSTTTGGVWSSAANWGGSLPVAGDDIVINISGTSNFTITSVSNLAFNSVTIGGSGSGTVTLQSSASTGNFGVFTVNANTTLTGFGIQGITLSGTTGRVANGKLLTVGSSASLKINTSTVFTVYGTITTTSSANANPFSTSSVANLVIASGGVINYNSGSSMLTTALMTVQAGGTLNVISSNTVTFSAMAIAGKLTFTSTGTSPIHTSGTAPAYTQGSTLEYLNCTAIPENIKAWPTTNGPTNVIINSPNGVTISASRTITGILTLLEGKLTTNSATSLLVSNTASNAISGGSLTSFINGAVKWALNSATTYQFPVGKGSIYLPFAINVTGSAPTIQVEAFNIDCMGIGTPEFVSLSNTEYWSALITSGSITNAVVGLTRQTPVGTFNAIGRSSIANGVYECLNGSPSGNSISGSDATGSMLGYFVMGLKNDFVNIQSIEKYKTIRVFPNPTNDMLFIDCSQLIEIPKSIQIFNSNGQLCFETNDIIQISQHGIDIQTFAQGNYTITYIFENIRHYNSFIIY